MSVEVREKSALLLHLLESWKSLSHIASGTDCTQRSRTLAHAQAELRGLGSAGKAGVRHRRQSGGSKKTGFASDTVELAAAGLLFLKAVRVDLNLLQFARFLKLCVQRLQESNE